MSGSLRRRGHPEHNQNGNGRPQAKSCQAGLHEKRILASMPGATPDRKDFVQVPEKHFDGVTLSARRLLPQVEGPPQNRESFCS
jgi:hypothetical protein